MSAHLYVKANLFCLGKSSKRVIILNVFSIFTNTIFSVNFEASVFNSLNLNLSSDVSSFNESFQFDVCGNS